jgi:hypothetical protein
MLDVDPNTVLHGFVTKGTLIKRVLDGTEPSQERTREFFVVIAYHPSGEVMINP